MSEDGGRINERAYEAALNPNDPKVQVHILGTRVDALTREKEKLERDYEKLNDRVLKMEKSFDRGAGILLVTPVIGFAIGIIATYWRQIFKPWITP